MSLRTMDCRRWCDPLQSGRRENGVMRIYSTELFYPMLAMFIWTVLVMLRNVQVRVAAVRRGELEEQEE
jgi:hypothetical protein